MGNSGQKQPGDGSNGLQWLIWGLFSAVLMMAVLSNALFDTRTGPSTVPYSVVKKLIRDGQVVSADLQEHAIVVTTSEANAAKVEAFRAVTPAQGDPELLPLLEQHNVEIRAEAPAGVSLLTYILPWIVILAVYLWLQRRMMGNIAGGNGGLAGGLLGGRFSKPSATREKVIFSDVAGQDQAKKEVAELVDFLRDPQRFERVGAKVPHGVLLVGPPGTGKTLLAKALAGEADVPFFSTSGSEFIEIFVGVGAGRVRKMFEAARQAAPSIIFIDELDSIGRTRGTGLGGGHDEREQTLNQILAELDGFAAREAVVVLAATNRPDVLDPALLRPGRFDRHVTLNLPDKAARRAILGIHARDLPLEDPADLDVMAAGTPGFSGADLKNLLNEAAITAARRNGQRISRDDLGEARDKVMMGTVRSLAIRPEEKHRLAVHEAGHTAAAYFTPGADPLYKVTIIPRGHALGGTHMLMESERHTLDEAYLRGQLVTLLAGRSAEKLLLGTVSSGADDDIRRATELARSMVARWGMTEGLGPVDLRQSEDHPFLGQSIAQPRNHADATAAQVDAAIIDLLKDAEAQAVSVLTEHRPRVERLVASLEAKETLTFDEIRQCLEPDNKVTPLKRPKGGREDAPPDL
ncbi:ATP-dependent zinc metalloprotease FtsH [Stappia taiwanensis]|uniref:ATP-dependent zinc metalloprotease FtsH n=1 Tax=Stappia taiwanensis TaxID=992267 RepID=A0A838XJR9_9HYPH|nr:ATP-dependent zinc metalloprotease FtsH [Stappia taiwanensis]MBA4610117.1 ATP-dependent zinc metalloprotease FtsH [Stappia taiwanensis]GGE77041.1 ATP-dependent zinc metalloprotease FtsH [Stappia taiwanensis]